MTTRERWIVYPLLLLSLGIALRDKVVPPMHTTTFAVTAHKIEADRVETESISSPTSRQNTLVVTAHVIEADTIRCRTLQADRFEGISTAADKPRWEGVDIEAAKVRFRLPAGPQRPEKTDTPKESVPPAE